MATCELCGTNTDRLVQAEIAGTHVKACENCKKMGKVVSTTSSHSFYRNKKQNENNEQITNNYSELIKQAIAKQGMDTHKAARAINIKESTLSQYISGKIKPDLATAKKIENSFKIHLTEQTTLRTNKEDFIDSTEQTSQLTLGDLIKKSK